VSVELTASNSLFFKMSKPKLKLKRLNPAETPSRADYEMHTKTKEEWMEFMVNMVKVKSDMPNMSDK